MNRFTNRLFLLVGYFALALLLLTMLCAILLTLTPLLVFRLGPALETRYAPVLVDAKVVSAVYDDEGWLTLDIVATKVRNCQRISTGWLIGTPERYRHLHALSLRPKDDAGETPAGRMTLWPQRLDVRDAKPGDQIIGISYHECQSYWDTATDIGPFEIPPPPAGEFTAASGPGR